MASEIVLAASAARTTGASGTAVFIGQWWKRLVVVLDVTASATAAGDTGDFFVDVSPDGSKWLNAVHFAQQAGNGAAKTEIAILDASGAPGAVTILTTSDCGAGVTRAAAWGKYARARWALVDAGGADTSHTFSVKAYAQ